MGEARQYALAALLNMSTVSKAQLIIASQALYAVLRVLYAPPELEATDPSLTKVQMGYNLQSRCRKKSMIVEVMVPKPSL